MPLLRKNPFEFQYEPYKAKSRVLRVSVEDFVILACIILTQYQHVTDGQTDGETHANRSCIVNINNYAKILFTTNICR